MSKGRDDGPGWKWSWNPVIGIMYGPIPVGIILIVLVVIGYFAFFHR